MRSTLAAAIGAATAVAVDLAAVRIAAHRRVELTAVGLVGAAAIYPLARRGGFGDGLERATLAASVALVGTAVALPPGRARQVVAAGWLAHAAFDAAFHPNRTESRIPSWYPAMCAGYDAAVAARLALG